MPNLRRQILGDLSDLGPPFVGVRGLHLTASDGRSITLTKPQIQALYATTSGSAAARRLAVIALIQAQVQAAVGGEQIPPAALVFGAIDATGEITSLEVGQ